MYPETKTKENIFMAIDELDDNKTLKMRKTRQKRLEDKLKHVERVQTGQTSNYEKEGNGRIVFEDRHTAIFASAISYALKNSPCNKEKLQTLIQSKS